MRTAICQMSILWEDKAGSVKKCIEYIKEAKRQHADIIFFPEMSLTGFSMNVDKTKEANYETLNLFSDAASKYGIAIGFGWVCSKEDKAQNRYTIVDAAGKSISEYTKIHPFSYAGEDRHFIAGEKLSLCEFKEFTIAATICYDLRFPEIYQMMSKKSDVIVVAANWPKARREHWISLLRARAIENQVYMIGVNCTGEIGGLQYSGDSQIINPNGDILIHMESAEGIAICDIENDVDHYRDIFPVKSDRKEELYEKLRDS